MRKSGKMLVLRAPRDGPFLLSRQPLPELIASLQSSSVACQQWAAAFTAVGASMLVAAAAQQAATWLRKRRIRARVEKAMRERRAAAAAAGGHAGALQPAGTEGDAAAGAAEEGGEGVGREGVCVICFERRPETVFPCGHMCACFNCSNSLRRCPICRTRGAPIRVYHP